ncbi:hypothetical protein N7492_003735 [Penicillium capsulatum]|uniref:AA1-like domain-containing protein n=1 Tax=Penicillium capsulatum TaxID=69766 RepID=A0A9W9IP64_9EURO|nr:hypothetical protein N7492_003735 [Penicillium capsulatum]KAJ6121683.1 hypothetical protein N7512_004148 [Penicillium capsulatum]
MFSKFLPIALLAVAPAVMAGPGPAPPCSATVQLNSAIEDGKSTIAFDIHNNNTYYHTSLDSTEAFCTKTLFQSKDVDGTEYANIWSYQPKGSVNGNAPWPHPFVWQGECGEDEYGRTKFTYVSPSLSQLVDTDIAS